MIKEQRLFIYSILLTCVVLFTSGCGGWMAMGLRNSVVGNEGIYSERFDSLPAIPEGKGRVFIYMADGGPSFYNWGGIIAEPLSIDNIMYFSAGETFFYVDLDVGKHKLTASSTVKGVFKKEFCVGENAIDFVLANQDTQYVRVDYKGLLFSVFCRFVTYHPTLIESKQIAEKEISPLDLNPSHTHGMFGVKVWKIGDSYI